MIRPIALSLVSIFCSLLTFAQVSSSDIVFESKTVDFGDIYMELGPVTAKYQFTNQGTEDFIISNVDAACGCTNSRASLDTIKPGESGFISAVFDPKGMLGEVNKWVYVYARMKDALQIDLDFTANIKTASKKAKGTYYRGEYGYLLVDKADLYWGDKFLNTRFKDSLVLTNDGYNDIIVKKMMKQPKFISSPNLPLTIAPGEKEVMYLDIDLTQVDTVGGYYDDFQLLTTDKFYKRKLLNYGLNFKIDFSSWKRKELKKAPQLTLSTASLNYGTMNSGTVEIEKITISNTGLSVLDIKRVDTDCSCALLQLEKTKLQPGESITVGVKFDSLFKEGTQNKVITIYSNDPKAPVQTLIVKANVL